MLARGVRVLSIGNMYPPHDLGGGYELTWRSSVLHLREAGHEVRVLTSDYEAPGVEPGAGDPGVHRELLSYWRDHEFPRFPLRERVAIERHNAAVLERHLGELRPDVVSWWGMGSMSLGLVERVRRAGVPAVGVVGDEWMVWGPRADGWLRMFRGRRRPLAPVAGRLARLPTRIDFSGAATWLFNSDANRRRSIEATGPLAGARVAHPGVEPIFEAAPERPWEWRLLYVGRMDDRKGVHVAVDALGSLPEAARLTLLGSGEEGYVASLRERIAGFGGRVTLSAVRREEIPAAYAAADAVLFPVQWEEPWGLVPLEAMAVGRPVVASGTGGSAEYLRHEQNALVYAPRDSAGSLAEAIRRLAADDALRTRLREGGLATAARHTARGYDEAIEAALVEAARRRERG
jgi:glycosyltransferase involved in cell wall biosynthesis